MKHASAPDRSPVKAWAPNRIVIVGGAGEDLSRVLTLLRDAGHQIAHYDPTAPIIALERRSASEETVAHGEPVSDEIVVGEFALSQGERVLRHGARSVALSPRQFRVMRALMCAPQTTLTRAHLCHEARIRTSTALARSRSLDMQILDLRRFIERDMSQPTHILTVRQVGYRFEPVAAPALAQLYRRRIERPAKSPVG